MAASTVSDLFRKDWNRRVAAFADRVLDYSTNGEEVLDTLMSAFEGPRPDDSLLPAQDKLLLADLGVDNPDRTSAQRAELAKAFAELTARSLTVEQFASRVSVTPSRIRQRLNHDRTLWGFKTGSRRQWRIPEWELLGDEILPGLDEFVKAIPADMHPVAVAGLVHSANPDLIINDSAVSARDWLASGYDPAIAAAAVGDPADLT